MKTKKFLFYLLAALLGSCIPSLHPLYTDKELLFKENLIGTWTEEDSQWVFEEGSEPNSYDLAVTDNEGKGEFTAHLVKIDNMLFLDLFPEEPDLEGANDFYKSHLLPVHTFIKVEQIEPILKMRMMDPEEMGDMLENDPNLIKHEIVEDRVVLTASTNQLQKFMKEHANDEGLFNEPIEMKRPELKEPNEPSISEPNDSSKEK